MRCKSNVKKKTILTTEGFLTFERKVYRPKDKETSKIFRDTFGVKQCVPLDIYLGIHRLPFKVTVNMALRLAMIGAMSTSYEAAEEFFKESYDISVSDDLIRMVTDYIGSIVFDEDKRVMQESFENYDKSMIRANPANCIAPNPDISNRFVLYILMDGGTYNTRNSKDKNGSTYREHKLGMVFKSTDLKIVQRISDTGQLTYEQKLGEVREYICCTEDINEFRKYLLALAMRNGLYEAEQVVILGDGADWIENTFEMLFPYATQILDIYHLKENVASFARHIIKDDNQRKEWVSDVIAMLENGGWQSVLALPEVQTYKINKTPPGVSNLYRYIYNHRNIINYPEYKSKGYFVGSGAIESGIKNIGHRRIKLGGMRWWQDRAQTILSLRAKIYSNLWDDKVVPIVNELYRK